MIDQPYKVSADVDRGITVFPKELRFCYLSEWHPAMERVGGWVDDVGYCMEGVLMGVSSIRV